MATAEDLYGNRTRPTTSDADIEALNKINKHDISTRFNREFKDFFLYRSQYADPLVTGYNYLFFTAPELNISKVNMTGTSKLIDDIIAANTNFLKIKNGGASVDSHYSPEMVESLAGIRGTFLKFLTNRARSTPGANVTLDTIDYAETWNNYKILLGTTTKASRVAGTFDISFMEDSTLRTTRFFNLWVNYIEALWLGDVIGRYASTAEKYSNNLSPESGSAIDYVASMYQFNLAPDGRTINYYAKYTGIFPTGVPLDVFQSTDGEHELVQNVNIPFAFSYKEDLNPAILKEFNILSNAAHNGKDMVNPTGDAYDDNGVNIGSLQADLATGVVKHKNSITGEDEYHLILRESNPYGNASNVWESNKQ